MRGKLPKSKIIFTLSKREKLIVCLMPALLFLIAFVAFLLYQQDFAQHIFPGPQYRAVERFLSQNWYVVLLSLIVSVLGYRLYLLEIEIKVYKDKCKALEHQKEERDKEIENLKEKEKDTESLETQQKTVIQKDGFESSEDIALETPDFIPWDEHQKALVALKVLREKESEMSIEIREKDSKLLGLQEDSENFLKKQEELNKEITSLNLDLQGKKETIIENDKKIEVLKTDLERQTRNLTTLSRNVSYLKDAEYPRMMHGLLISLIDSWTKAKGQDKTSNDLNQILKLYQEFEKIREETRQISTRIKSIPSIKTTYLINNMLIEVGEFGVFINRELQDLFLSKEEFEFKGINIELEMKEDLREKYDQEIQRHVNKIYSSAIRSVEIIRYQNDLGKHLENIKKHILEEVANQVFITCAELEKNKNTDAREAKKDLDKIKDRLTRIIVEHYCLEPMEIQIGKDFNSDEFEIVNRVEGGEYGQFGSNSIVSITTWGYYLAGTKKPYSLAKVQVKV